MSLLVLLVLHHIWIKSRVLRGTWSGTNMCSSGLRYCQFLVKVFFSSSSSPQEQSTRRGDQTNDHTSNEAWKPDVTPRVSGLFFSLLFSFCRFVVKYVLGPWKYSQMRDACLNHNMYYRYMRDITAIYTIRYKKKSPCWCLSKGTDFLKLSCTYQKQKHISCNTKWMRSVDTVSIVCIIFFKCSHSYFKVIVKETLLE